MNFLPILVLLVIAICSGLAFLAYKHPKGFSKITVPLYVIIIIVYLTYLAWTAGFQAGFQSVNTIENYEDGFPIGNLTAFIICLISIGYVGFLSFLPMIISADKNASAKNEDTE